MNLPHILDNIIDLFKPKGESVLGIDIGSSSIKIVQVRNKAGQAVLETYGEVALGPYVGVDIGRGVKLQAAELSTAIGDVLREANTTTKIGGVAISLSSSLINVIKVPRVNKNMEEVVAIEARRYIPVSLSEVTLDWQVIPPAPKTNISDEKSNEGGNLSSDILAEKVQANNSEREVESVGVLIVAVHTEAIEKLKDMTSRSELECRFFELEAFSTIRAVTNKQVKVSAVVDFGASSTKVYVTENGIIKVSHVISFGSQDITLAVARSTGMPIAEAERLKRTEGIPATLGGVNLGRLMEGSVSFIANEVSRVLNEYQSREGVVIKEIVLSGGGVNVKGLSELFAQKMNIPVRVSDPFSSLIAPVFLERILKTAGPSFSVAIGLALRAVGEGH